MNTFNKEVAMIMKKSKLTVEERLSQILESPLDPISMDISYPDTLDEEYNIQIRCTNGFIWLHSYQDMDAFYKLNDEDILKYVCIDEDVVLFE